jgi:predicted porin
MPIRSIRRAATVPLLSLSVALLSVPDVQAQGIPKIEKEFANGGKLRFYGQINKGFLNYDDGLVSESYNFIDNNNSNTRFGLTYSAKINDQWDYLGTVEIQYAPYSTSNQALDPATGEPKSNPASAYEFTNANIRKIDNKLSNKEIGSFYLGQGDMASNDTAKVDFSGTTVIAGVAVQDSAGGQLIRQENGTLSKIKISDAFKDYNGLGRKVRVRYDTPDFNGFSFRASYGQDQLSTNEAVQDNPLYDIAAVYANEFGDFKVGAQVAYAWNDVKDKDTTTTTLSASGSVLHTPTGLNLTLASASQDNETLEGSYWYAKGGWIGDLVSWGKTAVSVDYYSGTDIYNSGTSSNPAGSESESTGLAIVQNVTDWNTEFWLTYRTYDLDTPKIAYDSSNALFFGARFRF